MYKVQSPPQCRQVNLYPLVVPGVKVNSLQVTFCSCQSSARSVY